MHTKILFSSHMYFLFPLLPQCEKEDTGEPKDTLTLHAQHQIQALGSHNTKVSEIVTQQDRAVFTAIQEGLDRANKHTTCQAQKVGILCIANLSILPSWRAQCVNTSLY